MSGGERRRTEIARCLAIDPKFIMLDEPFAGVDPIAVEDIQDVYKRQDVILFVVDVINGVTDLDLQVASILRRTKKPVLLIANKTDNNELQYNAPEFYSLGLGDPYCISTMSGSGTGDLLDSVVAALPEDSEAEGFDCLLYTSISVLPNSIRMPAQSGMVSGCSSNEIA